MKIHITYDELNHGNLPDSCVLCGDTNVVFVNTVLSHAVDLSLLEYKNCELPLCSRHASPGWFGKIPTIASFDKQGVIIKNASADFIDDLEDLRDRRSQRASWPPEKRAHAEQIERDRKNDRRHVQPKPTSWVLILLIAIIIGGGSAAVVFAVKGISTWSAKKPNYSPPGINTGRPDQHNPGNLNLNDDDPSDIIKKKSKAFGGR